MKRLEIAIGTVANAAKISSLATKNSGLVNSRKYVCVNRRPQWRLRFSVLTINNGYFSDIMSFQKYIVKDLCFCNTQYKKRRQCIFLLCRDGFPRIGKLANGWSCLKSPYNALQTIEDWVRHVCLPIVSLGNAWIFHRHYISYVYKISGPKSLGNFFFTDFMHWVLFWIKFLLDFYHLVAKWLLKNLLTLTV